MDLEMQIPHTHTLTPKTQTNCRLAMAGRANGSPNPTPLYAFFPSFTRESTGRAVDGVLGGSGRGIRNSDGDYFEKRGLKQPVIECW